MTSSIPKVNTSSQDSPEDLLRLYRIKPQELEQIRSNADKVLQIGRAHV